MSSACFQKYHGESKHTSRAFHQGLWGVTLLRVHIHRFPCHFFAYSLLVLKDRTAPLPLRVLCKCFFHRVLVPGGIFCLVSLGDPSCRLGLLCRPEFGWTVTVCLLPRAPPETGAAEAEEGKDGKPRKPKPLKYIGPYSVKEDLTLGK